jgi:hypothetical protein
MKTLGAQTICINSKNEDEILLTEVGFFFDATGEELMKARLKQCFTFSGGLLNFFLRLQNDDFENIINE